MSSFTGRELEVLTAICDTLAPALAVDLDPAGLYARRASDLNVPQVMAQAIAQAADPETLTQLKIALALLDQPLANALDGFTGSILDMTLPERTALLRRWSDSRIDLRRKAFNAFKRLALYFFYTVLDEQGCNPNQPAIGYTMPPASAAVPTEKPIRPLVFTEDTTLTADVVIVGSGAGGGVVAGELSAAGLDVIVLEKGDYYAEPDFDGRELASTERMFENRGFLTTADLGVTVLAGSTLGGGTTINWSASLRTPDHVLQEWERYYGVTGYTGQQYQQAMDAVSARINVNENECVANPQNAALARGAEALGYSVKTIPRNVSGCEDCGFCNFGCQFGAKQSTLRTYLQDAYQRGTRIAVNTQVERVLIRNGAAVGVAATTRSSSAEQVRLTVKARAVVVAAGTIHTPAVLLRSGLTNANIGRNLHLHPTSVTYGLYDTSVRGWQGVPMSRYVNQFTNLDAGYGVVLETAPIHPGIAALTLPWRDGLGHKQIMARLANLANIIIITRDRDGGQVTVDRRGKPVLHYRLSAYDDEHLMRGVIESLRIHKAAGASEISGPHAPPLIYDPAGSQSFDDFLKTVQTTRLRRNSFALFSAHQMSSCRMGANPARGAIDPTGEAFEARGLFVADASAMPTASGTNPMLTAMAIAYMVAQHIKTKL